MLDPPLSFIPFPGIRQFIGKSFGTTVSLTIFYQPFVILDEDTWPNTLHYCFDLGCPLHKKLNIGKTKT